MRRKLCVKRKKYETEKKRATRNGTLRIEERMWEKRTDDRREKLKEKDKNEWIIERTQGRKMKDTWK